MKWSPAGDHFAIHGIEAWMPAVNLQEILELAEKITEKPRGPMLSFLVIVTFDIYKNL